MRFNEERVKLFATILRLMTNPEIIKQLDGDEAFDYEALVRAIAEMVPLPAIDLAAPVLYPVPATAPFPTLPTWSPMRPLIGDPIGGSTVCSSPVKAENFVTAMGQADGMGDDSGTRGD